MKIGYARVSTGDQNLDMQIDKHNKIECDKIFTDKMRGARSDRPGFSLLSDDKMSQKLYFSLG